jgi:hypothetical protein
MNESQLLWSQDFLANTCRGKGRAEEADDETLYSTTVQVTPSESSALTFHQPKSFVTTERAIIILLFQQVSESSK